MTRFLNLPIVAFSILFSQDLGSKSEANLSLDEDARSQHVQSIDGVAAVVGDRVILKSDINQALAMAVFQRQLNPQQDIEKIEKLKSEIIKSIVNRKIILAMAELDSIEVTDKEVDRALNQQVENIVAQAGGEDAAEKALGQPVEKAVITVPAYFDDAQRQATRDAARIAGLEIVRIINEPTAAAIAYGLDEKTQGYVAVYDLGGGTFDISILELSGKLFKVLATHGDTRRGGDDIDRILIELFRRQIRLENPQKDCGDSQSIQILRKAAEELKISLSNNPESEYSIDLPASESG